MGSIGGMSVFVAAVVGGGYLLWWAVLGRRWAAVRRRARFEDALKHLLACRHGGRQASVETLGGALGRDARQVMDVVVRLEARGLVISTAGGLELTSEGESWALQVVRAHRIWERYLADEANVPLDAVHGLAETVEHRLTAEQVDALDAHLGHPAWDPHGDPIPTASGEVELADVTALTEWPTGEPARIMHIEDEPEVVFHQIVAQGLRPGSVIRILARDARRLVLSDGESEQRLAPALAAQIQVAAVEADASGVPAGAVALTAMAMGQEAEVIDIDGACRGLSRRRLLDLGLTAGARVRPELNGPFGGARAFTVRGAMIALREEQAGQIWVRPVGG